MKKLAAALTLLAAFICGPIAARADFLSAVQPITVTGSIQAVGSAANSNGLHKVTSSPATIANILKALGIAGQNPKKLRFYFDSTTSSVVIADKSIATSGGTGTPVATVFTFGSSPESWSKGGTTNYAGGDCTSLGQNLPGTYTELSSAKQKKSKTVYSDVTTFITWGTISGNSFIFKGTIRGIVRFA